MQSPSGDKLCERTRLLIRAQVDVLPACLLPNSYFIYSALASEMWVDMPITQCVVKVLDGTLSAKQAVGLLMGRDATGEL